MYCNNYSASLRTPFYIEVTSTYFTKITIIG
uniref:Uncharacterized protein n=1 Tax=Anguilla anguilla TaxID=7936 RepID=A0A0E9XMH6_ANGAN